MTVLAQIADGMVAALSRFLKRRAASIRLRELGPYIAIELILPGGSLIALLLWFCRQRWGSDMGSAERGAASGARSAVRAALTMFSSPPPTACAQAGHDLPVIRR